MRRFTAFLLTIALVGVCAVLPLRCEGGFKTALAAITID